MRRILQGTHNRVTALIQASRGGSDLNTAYIERLNATFRSRLASLARRSRTLLRQPETLTPLVYLIGSVYNFCCSHQSLLIKLWVGNQNYRCVQLRGYHDCPYIGQSMRADRIDDQVAELIRSIHLLENCEPIVRQMLNEQRAQVDPEAERKEIRGMLRLMQDIFEQGLYEEEEYQYWQKVSALKENLALLERTPKPAINRAAKTLMDLCETWENSTKEKRGDLVHIMLQ